MNILKTHTLIFLLIWIAGITVQTQSEEINSSVKSEAPAPIPEKLAPYFIPPLEWEEEYGDYRSPLLFNDGSRVQTKEDWRRRRGEILETWHGLMGAWPPLLESPAIEWLEKENLEKITRQKVKIEIAPDHRTIDGYWMLPKKKGPFAAVIVVYYDPEAGAGLGREMRDFGLQLANRGIAALSIGLPESLYYPSKTNAELQPLSALAYAAANCYNAIAALPKSIRNGSASQAIPMVGNGRCSLPVSMRNSPAPSGRMEESYLMKTGPM